MSTKDFWNWQNNPLGMRVKLTEFDPKPHKVTDL